MTTPQTAPTIHSRADVATSTPERFAKQLVAHLGRKVAFTTGRTSSATMGAAVGRVVVGDGILTLLADGDAADVARVEHVLGSHLERFAHREPLVVTWQRSNGTGDGTGTNSTDSSTDTDADIR